MKRKSYILVFILAMACFDGHGQRFTLLQTNQINTEVNRALQVFGKYSAYAPGEVPGQEIPAEFQVIFSPDARILNFLEPEAGNRNPVSPAEYYQYIRKHYTFGLSYEQHWNAGKMSRPMATDEQNTSFVVYLPVSVKSIGLFDGQKINNVSGEYYAIIGFRMENGHATDGVIHYMQAEKPRNKFAQKVNILIGPYVGPAFTRIHSQDIFADEVWDAWGEFGYRAGLKVVYLRSSNLGLFSGAGISYYRSVYEIVDFNNESLVKTVKTDVDGDEYFEFIKASVTEKNSLMYFDIPLGIRYSTGGNKFRLVMQAGFEFSFLVSSRYSVTGNSDHQGYYPEYHVVLYDLPDYGFTAGPVDINKKWKLNLFNLSANVSAGVEVSLGNSMLLTVSPYANAGLTDLGYDVPKHRDDYISISGNPGKLTTRSAGLLFEVFFNL
jgi:hypothetical protein